MVQLSLVVNKNRQLIRDAVGNVAVYIRYDCPPKKKDDVVIIKCVVFETVLATETGCVVMSEPLILPAYCETKDQPRRHPKPRIIDDLQLITQHLYAVLVLAEVQSKACGFEST
jgi:hypothetical protein